MNLISPLEEIPIDEPKSKHKPNNALVIGSIGSGNRIAEHTTDKKYCVWTIRIISKSLAQILLTFSGKKTVLAMLWKDFPPMNEIQRERDSPLRYNYCIGSGV
jgi:hypothetical protein